MKVVAAIIIVITRNTEEADVAEDVKQSLPQIIKVRLFTSNRHNLTFYAQRGDVSVCGHSNQWNLEQSLPNFQLAIRFFQMPFYLSGPA